MTFLEICLLMFIKNLKNVLLFDPAIPTQEFILRKQNERGTHTHCSPECAVPVTEKLL